MKKRLLFLLEHLSKVFTPFQPAEDLNGQEMLNYLESTHQMFLPIKSTSPKEIKKVISALKIKKAAGYDLISDKVPKELPKKAIIFIVSIINAILRTGFRANEK